MFLFSSTFGAEDEMVPFSGWKLVFFESLQVNLQRCDTLNNFHSVLIQHQGK